MNDQPRQPGLVECPQCPFTLDLKAEWARLTIVGAFRKVEFMWDGTANIYRRDGTLIGRLDAAQALAIEGAFMGVVDSMTHVAGIH